MSRASKPNEHREPAQAGPDQATPSVRVGTAANLYADAEYPPGDVRNEPAVRAWLEEAASRPSALAQLRALRAARLKRGNFRCSPFAWWAWCAVVDQLERRVSAAMKHPNDEPISAGTIGKLRSALDAMLAELHETRPW